MQLPPRSQKRPADRGMAGPAGGSAVVISVTLVHLHLPLMVQPVVASTLLFRSFMQTNSTSYVNCSILLKDYDTPHSSEENGN